MAASHVLVIDDEQHIRAFVRDALETFGYAVDVAADGVQGLALFDQHHYDLLLLDLRMPHLGGWEVLQAITWRRPTRAVIMSGFVTPMDEEQARQLGVVILRKPFTVADFKQVVQEALAGPPGAEEATGEKREEDGEAELRRIAQSESPPVTPLPTRH